MHLYEIKLLIQGRIAYVHRMDHIHSKIVQKIVKQVGCFGVSGVKLRICSASLSDIVWEDRQKRAVSCGAD